MTEAGKAITSHERFERLRAAGPKSWTWAQCLDVLTLTDRLDGDFPDDPLILLLTRKSAEARLRDLQRAGSAALQKRRRELQERLLMISSWTRDPDTNYARESAEEQLRALAVMEEAMGLREE